MPALTSAQFGQVAPGAYTAVPGHGLVPGNFQPQGAAPAAPPKPNTAPGTNLMSGALAGPAQPPQMQQLFQPQAMADNSGVGQFASWTAPQQAPQTSALSAALAPAPAASAPAPAKLAAPAKPAATGLAGMTPLEQFQFKQNFMAQTGGNRWNGLSGQFEM